MGHLGLEPRTIRLKAEYSTIELVTLMKLLYKIILNLTRLKINLFISVTFFYYFWQLINNLIEQSCKTRTHLISLLLR